MLQVLLVDDEPFITRGLSVLVDWEALGFHIAGTAGNGREALDFLRAHPVDLVIADIQMPEMSGLQLAETIRAEHLSDAYFVILSGYSNFEYARRAIHCECVDYLLKPVQPEQLTELLQTIRQSHATSQQQKDKDAAYGRAYLAQNVLGILHGHYDSDNLEYLKKHLCLSEGMRYLAVELDFSALKTPPARERCTELQRTLFESCRQALGPKWENHCVLDVLFEKESYDISMIFCQEMAREKGQTEQEWMESFRETIRRGCEVPIMLFVGEWVGDATELVESCRTAMVARSFRTYSTGQANILFYQAKTDSQAERISTKTVDALVKAMEENEKEAIQTGAQALYDEINAAGMNAEMIQLNINYLLLQLVHLACRHDDTVDQEEILHYIQDNAFQRGAMRGSCPHLQTFCSEFADYLESLRQNQSQGVLPEIEREIGQHYAENLTLKGLSQKYYINSAYLGQVFRKRYGQSFKDYLNGYRIEKAAGLLASTQDKVYQVAQAVGYRDMDYFIEKFIAQKGCTPTNYRRQMTGQ